MNSRGGKKVSRSPGIDAKAGLCRSGQALDAVPV